MTGRVTECCRQVSFYFSRLQRNFPWSCVARRVWRGLVRAVSSGIPRELRSVKQELLLIVIIAVSYLWNEGNFIN
jgi:hypothetical protein